MCHGQLSQHNEAWEDYEEAVALLEDPEAPSSAVRKRSHICTNSPPICTDSLCANRQAVTLNLVVAELRCTFTTAATGR